jgi:hypothetical protein
MGEEAVLSLEHVLSRVSFLLPAFRYLQFVEARMRISPSD